MKNINSQIAKERLDDSTKFFVGSKEIFEKAFKHLQHIKHTATEKGEIQELLEASEVPHFMLVDPRKLIKKRTNSGDKVISPADFGSPFLNDYSKILCYKIILIAIL